MKKLKKKLKKIEKIRIPTLVMKPVIRFVLVIYATCACVTEFFGIIWDKGFVITIQSLYLGN